MSTKICKKCGEEKELSEFYKDKQKRDGFYCYCKKCHYIITNRYKKNHLNKTVESNKRCYERLKEKNPEKVKESNRKGGYRYRKNNPEKVKKNKKIWYENNPEKVKIIQKRYRKNNYKKIEEGKIRFKEKNPYYQIEYQKKYLRERKKIDIEFKTKCNISSIIYKSFKKQGGNKNKISVWKYIDWTFEEFKAHMESLFEPWMNWNNWTNKKGCWTIDHTIAQSKFKFVNSDSTTNFDEVRKCWLLSNLTPMEFIKNIKKGNK